MAGVSYSPKRWGIAEASQEFDLDRATLSKALRAQSIEPGEDGKFSTAQICAAKYTDYEIERARKVRAEANMREREDARQNKIMCFTDDAVAYVAALCLSIRQTILASELPEQEKRDLCAELATKGEESMISEGVFQKR